MIKQKEINLQTLGAVLESQEGISQRKKTRRKTPTRDIVKTKNQDGRAAGKGLEGEGEHVSRW